jgi:hydroxyethylthiazole kinase-like uncharacterized protein yjeF
MERLVSAAEMKWCDEATIRDVGIPGRLLMENAGVAVAREICSSLGDPREKRVVVFCGKGNNGGDGFVIARHLLNAGVAVYVILLTSPVEFKGDALANFSILKKLSVRSTPPLRIERYVRKNIENLGTVDAVVDAVFGTGFSGTVKEPAFGVIEWINTQRAPVFSVDVPSGLNATSGIIENTAVRANHTVTFGLRKTGLLLNHGQEYAGNVVVVDIGIPRIVTESRMLSRTFLVSNNDVRAVLPSRPLTAHKYSVGKVFVLAGSKGYTGAAALCAMSALRAGAGAVVLGTPETIYPVLSRKLTEVIVTPLASTAEGSLSERSFDVIQSRLSWADVIVIGPGLSQHPETQSLIVRVLKTFSGRVLLDADGLNAVSLAGIGMLKKLRSEIVLTPHTGEFSRLTGVTPKDIDRDRIEMARTFARTIRKTIILKGAPTVTASSEGSVYVNASGNPGMATIGSGDVLSGIIAGLWSQKMTITQASYAGVYLHGLAGDLAAKKFGQRSMVAGDLIAMLPDAIVSAEREGHA